MSTRQKRGFTFNELLIVISGAAILIASLFPVFARVRENAGKEVCMNNLKQLGVSFKMYAQDYDGVLPALDNGNGPTLLWTQRLGAYGVVYTDVKSPLYCPSADAPAGSFHWYPSYGALFYGPLRWYNPARVIRWNGSSHPPAALTDIQDASRTILLGEQAQKSVLTKGYFLIKNAPAYHTCFPGRHEGTDNLLFVDGHVAAKDTAQLNKWLETPSRGGKYPYLLDF